VQFGLLLLEIRGKPVDLRLFFGKSADCERKSHLALAEPIPLCIFAARFKEKRR